MGFLIDAAAAREMHRNLIRRARAPAMKVLDDQAWRALEAGTPLTGIAAAKATLMDLPSDPAIDAAEDVAALRAVWHEALGDIVNVLPPPGLDPLLPPPPPVPLSEEEAAALLAFVAARDQSIDP